MKINNYMVVNINMFHNFPHVGEKGVMVLDTMAGPSYKEVTVSAVHDYRSTPTITVSYIVRYAETNELVNSAQTDDKQGRTTMIPYYRSISYPVMGKMDMYPSTTDDETWTIIGGRSPYVVFGVQADEIRDTLPIFRFTDSQ
jgi:hypothetical protein